MSVSYKGITWTPSKRRYDLVLLAGIVVVLAVFTAIQVAIDPRTTAETILIRGTALTATLLLHVILAIGPIARLWRGTQPLLYNRRHLGVALGLLSFGHAALVTIQYHAAGDANPFVTWFTAYSGVGSGIDAIPFEAFGVFAFLIFALMATTSHDFWLNLLGASAWKALHSLVYVAYGLVVAHVALGYLQDQSNPLPVVLMIIGLAGLLILHLMAWAREQAFDGQKEERSDGNWVSVCAESELDEGCTRPVRVDGQRIALMRHEGSVHALHGVCRHQGGPLSEGKIVDGCLTCPWHGWQYKPEDGKSPPPFTEEVDTYPVRIVDGRIEVNSEATSAVKGGDPT
jgi:nitrite reductase/ring-hydroxylating ferredoxin subunit/DMSO/TMAO reductase YedYZ heme-binding membrane subunit